MSERAKTASGRGTYAPTDGLAYDPEDPQYWDEAALHRETARVFDVCAGCRMCFKYCDAFPKLFALADDEHDGDARALTPPRPRRSWTTASSASSARSTARTRRATATRSRSTFPKLAHRHRAQRARARGLTLRERVLANPDARGPGRAARAAASPTG